MLTIFFICIFATYGITLWSGLTHYRCRQTPFPVDGDWLPVYEPPGFETTCGGINSCEIACGSIYDLLSYHPEVNLTKVTDPWRDSRV